MNCDCFKFRDDLVNLSKVILVKGDGAAQWVVLKQFCLKYKRKRLQRSFMYGSFCSEKICSFLIRKLNEFMRRDMVLSTFLVDILTILFTEICVGSHMRRLWNTLSRDRETLRIIDALLGWNLNDDFMKLLLNFGFLSSLPIDSPHLITTLESEFATFVSNIVGYMPNMHSCEVRGKAMEFLVNSNIYHFKDRKNCKRMFLLTMALRGVQMSLQAKNNSGVEHFFNCLRMYFSATQDALISVLEVKSILYATFLCTDKLHLFNVCCQEFDKLMPDCPVRIEPRTLTHLARCKIRQNLKASNLPLPLAVDKLLLPSILKHFLLGEIFDISRSKGNDSLERSEILTELESMTSKLHAS